MRERPLRSPGQALQDEIERLGTDEFLQWGTFAVVFASMALFEWIRWATKSPPSPWVYSIVAAFAVGYSVFRLRLARDRLRQLRQGLAGERAVAEVLDTLRAKGAVVFHDVPAEGFNVDHVLVTPQGVYAIETKTLSKHRGSRVTFDSGTILVDGRHLSRDPLVQARAAAAWVRATLSASTGKNFPVRPVVLFPGWFVEPMKSQNAPESWILNPKSLPAFVAKEPIQLSEADLNLAAFHLSRYVKAAS